ncbi:MAG: hypothetical protein ABFS21_10310 [Actinomycetota bacterium]
MRPDVPQALLDQAAEWDELHRWERSELGKALRRLGLTYGEIREIIPVPKGTLSHWCRGIDLTADQIVAIYQRSSPGSRSGIPVDTQWRRRQEIEEIRRTATAFAEEHLDDSRFVAGVVLYWGEGAKTRNRCSLTNADPAALRMFIAWVRTYLDPSAEFTLSIHLHEGNNETTARSYWRRETALPDASFTKTYIKPRGTGHRKNHLPHGICRVRVRNPADHWNRIEAWIAVVREYFGPLLSDA